MFMRDGGVLGFNSHYSYVFDTQWTDLLAHINTIEDKADTIQQLNRRVSCDKFMHLSRDEQVKVLRDAGIEDVNCKQILDALPSEFPLLKGADCIVAESAKSLGLPVCVKPFLTNYTYDENFKYALKDFVQQFPVFEYQEEDLINDEFRNLKMFGDATCRYKPQDITWCLKLSLGQPTGASCVYGNESLELRYKSAAILIRVPKWSEYRQKLIAISIGESCSVKPETSDDGIIQDFKDVIHDYEDIVQEET